MSRRSFHVILTLTIGFLFVFGDAFLLCAKEIATEEFTLEEITVTAQKREENQQKVAIPMDVILGEKLAESGMTNVDDILAGISTVMINMSPDGMRVAVRGLVESELPTNDIHTSSPMVAINIDGHYNSANSAGSNLFDVERIEVLYGPQSTLYSSNSPGGIVNIVTTSPKTDKYSANATVEYGSFNLINANFAGNAPIVKDMLAMRLAAQYYTRGSYVSDVTGDRTKSVRLKTLYQPNDKFSATVTLNYTQRINGGMMMGNVRPFDFQDGHWYLNANAGPGTPTVWTDVGKVTNPWTPVSTTAGIGGGTAGNPPPPPGGGGGLKMQAGPNQGLQDTKGITGEIDWDTGAGNLSVVPQYSKTTSDDRENYTSTFDNQPYTSFMSMRSSQEGVEVRMASRSDFFFKWIFGFSYYRNKNERYDWATEADVAHAVMIREEKNTGVYGNATYPFMDKLRGTGGYRMSWTKGINGGTNPNNPSESTTTTSSLPKHPDYRLGVEYDVAANNMLYATYATSFRANPMAPGTALTEATIEKLKSYTIGSKNRFFENKLQVNIAAYYYDYRNKQANVTNDGRTGGGPGAGSSSVYVTNLYNLVSGEYVTFEPGTVTDGYYSGSLMDPITQPLARFRTIGVDTDAQWLITAKDRLTLGVSYLNATWQDLKIHWGYVYRDPDTGAITKFWPSDGMDFSGRQNIYSPTWTFTASYEHNFELGSYGMLTPHVDLQNKSSYLMDYLNAPINYQEAYHIINGSVTFTHSSGSWTLNGYVKNATNYCAKSMLINMATASLGVNDPRTYGAVFSVKF